MIITECSRSPPGPPSSSGSHGHSSPAAPALRHTSRSTMPASFQRSWWGTTSRERTRGRSGGRSRAPGRTGCVSWVSLSRVRGMARRRSVELAPEHRADLPVRSSPLLNTQSVGIERMPSAVGYPWWSCVLSFTTISLPACRTARSATCGPSVRHGPHHGAQKSTSTGTGAVDQQLQRRVVDVGRRRRGVDLRLALAAPRPVVQPGGGDPVDRGALRAAEMELLGGHVGQCARRYPPGVAARKGLAGRRPAGPATRCTPNVPSGRTPGRAAAEPPPARESARAGRRVRQAAISLLPRPGGRQGPPARHRGRIP
jgi:hypothetical protein